MTVEFIDDPVLRPARKWVWGRTVWNHVRDMRWSWFDGKTCHDFTIAAGSRSDGASIPFLFWWFISPSGRVLYAALVHDDIYRNHKAIFTRAEADRIFLEGMQAMGMWLRCWPAYWAVWAFGYWAWNSEERRQS